MSVRFPYIAVICGEEHIIKGWQGGKFITDKGSYRVGHIYGNWPIQDHRLFEIATIQPDNNGSWLLNGISYSKLEKFRLGARFSDLKTDENLRARKESICAVAWFDTTGKWTKTVELVDELLKFWKAAILPVVERKKITILEGREPSLALVLGELAGNMGETLLEIEKYKKLFPAWSKPAWLSEFRPAGQKKLKTAEQKQIAQITIELEETKTQLCQAQEVAGYTLQEALSQWFKFTPKRMSAERKAKIESAVKMYMTDSAKRSLAKIAVEFGVSRKTVSEWFAIFTKETGFKVVKHVRNVSVRDQIQTKSDFQEEE